MSYEFDLGRVQHFSTSQILLRDPAPLVDLQRLGYEAICELNLIRTIQCTHPIDTKSAISP